jgi:malonate-semialdehyde dehydrogenase (acetylating)/methylmalonate-semialdehyde dehydrogenase
MFRFKELVEANMDALAHLLSSEYGKVVADAKGDIQRGLDVIEFACGVPHPLKGEYKPGAGPGIDVYSMRMPLGIGAGITQFNFPAMIPMWMFGVAIACGNAFILKPNERDPSVPVRLAELMIEAGAPEGVLQVVHGDKEMVDAILDHPLIGAVSFVGWSDIAHYIYQRGVAAGKRVQAMGGAKNHGIVMPDADMDQVVADLTGAAFGSAGERCMALPVVVPVTDRTADELREALVPEIAKLRIGVSNDPDAYYDPVVNAAHKARVEGWIQKGVDQSAELVVDGRGFRLQGHEDGFLIGLSLFDNVTPEMGSYKEEIFGPVLQMVRAENFEEALALPSRHRNGNGVAIFTRNGHAAREFAARVEVGMVGINVPIPVPVAYRSFGGWKRSAFADTNQHGMEGVKFWTKVKTVAQRWPDANVSGRAGDSVHHPDDGLTAPHVREPPYSAPPQTRARFCFAMGDGVMATQSTRRADGNEEAPESERKLNETRMRGPMFPTAPIAYPTYSDEVKRRPMDDKSRAILQQCRDLVPELRTRSREIEDAGHMPEDLIQKIADIGVFRFPAPAEVGGGGLPHYPTHFRIMEELGRGTATAGWSSLVHMAAATLAMYLPLSGAQKLFATNRTVIAGTPGPLGRAVRVEGGYRILGGEWAWASNSKHATHFIAGFFLMPDMPPPGDAQESVVPFAAPAGPPPMYVAYIPANEGQVVEGSWDTIGLKGTHSGRFKLDGVFIPDDMCFTRMPGSMGGNDKLTADAPHGIGGHSAVLLGAARHALEYFYRLAKEKAPMAVGMQSGPLSERAVIQYKIGEVEGKLRATRALFYEQIDDCWTRYSAGEELTRSDHLVMQLANAHTARVCKDVVETIFELAGTSGVFRDSPLEQIMRDILTGQAHMSVQAKNYEAYGRAFLGEPATIFEVF